MQKKLSRNSVIGLFIMIVLVASSVALFAGCSGSTSADGTWKVDRVVVDNVTIKSTDGDKKGQESIFKNVLVLNKDKTGKATMGDSTEVSATWKQEGNTITISYGDKEYSYILSGTELTRTEGTTKIFYKKSA